jgi:hypothetical protein
MNRRTFLGAAATSAAAGLISSATNAAQAADAPASAQADSKNQPLAAPPPGVEYFTEERLQKAIDTSVPTDDIKFEVATFTFNPWHPSPYMEKTFGKGWTEYETMRMARPQFPGHYQPKRPLWGCFNEADPQWAAREIELAASAGINAFMIDWYWHEGTMFYHEQLEQGLLKAPNKDKMKFAVMWANHHWPNLYPAPEEGEEATLLPQNYSDADMDKVCEYLIEHYFTQPNYWKIKGKPVFGVFWGDHLAQHFTPAGLHKIWDGWQARAQKAGLDGIHFQSCAQYGEKSPLVESGYDSVTDYHAFAGGPKGKTSPYVAMCENAIKRWEQRWKQREASKLPYFPEVPVGWDNSPRMGKNAHVFVNRTSDQYERLLRAAKHFVAAKKIDPPIIYTGAWNEWTEDHYLLPDEVHGYSYLEAVRRQFGQKS